MAPGRSRAGLAARVGAVAALGVVATAGVAWAAAQGLPQAAPLPAAPAVETPRALVVPDVRRQAFVFAKSALEDAGFAWRVEGGVRGFPANTVVTQSPAPGARVVDTGSPLVTLTLRRTRGYPQAGEPADTSPYPGTAVRPAAGGGSSSSNETEGSAGAGP